MTFSCRKHAEKKGSSFNHHVKFCDWRSPSPFPFPITRQISSPTTKTKMLSADTSKPSSGGVYTCQTCNALFTCLDYYQKHRRQHAESEGVKLLTCAHCTYFSDNGFHYNWHIMSHASSPPHRCEVCAPENSSSAGGNAAGGGYTKQLNNLSPNISGVGLHKTVAAGGSASGGSNGLNGANDLHHFNQRISDSIISNDGKRRSIATETSDDLIHPSQIFSSPSSSSDNNVANGKTLRHQDEDDNVRIQDSGTDREQNQADDEETEEEDDEEEDDEETEDDETDVEMNYETSTNNHCDNGAMLQPPITNTTMNSLEQQQQFYYEAGEDDQEEEDEDEEDEEEGEDEENVHQQQSSYQDYNGGAYAENETTGGVLANHMMDDLGGGAGDALDYQEEDAAAAAAADQDGMLDTEKTNNCDTSQQQRPLQTTQPSTDVYDFNSDEELEQNGPQFKLPLSSSKSAASATNSLPPPQPHLPQMANIQFLNAAGAGQQPNPGQSLPQQPPVTQSSNTQQQNIQPSFLPMNANAFLFPTGPPTAGTGTFGNVSHHPNHQANHANHHQGAAAIFNPNAFTAAATANGPIQLLSIQPFPHHQNNAGNATAAFLQAAAAAAAAQTNGASNSAGAATGPLCLAPPAAAQAAPPNNASSDQQLPVTTASNTQNTSKLVFAKKTPKKITSTTPSSNNGVSSCNTSTTAASTVETIPNGTLIKPQDYVPIKGQGKGNRKPRITLVSVINGITVGADGIRRKFQCSLCGNGKSFKTKSHLQRHMLTHTGEKPYQCPECGAKFNQSSSLRNHIIAIHTKKFPHTCIECGKGFLMPAVLQKHLTSTGHNSPINLLSTPTGNSQSTGNSEDSSNSVITSTNTKQQPPLMGSLDMETMSALLQYSNNGTEQDSAAPDSTHRNNNDNGNDMDEFTGLYIKEEPDVDDDDDDDDRDDEEDETRNDATSNSVSTTTTGAAFGNHHHHQQQQAGIVTTNASSSFSASSTSPSSTSQPNLFFLLANSNR